MCEMTILAKQREVNMETAFLHSMSMKSFFFALHEVRLRSNWSTFLTEVSMINDVVSSKVKTKFNWISIIDTCEVHQVLCSYRVNEACDVMKAKPDYRVLSYAIRLLSINELIYSFAKSSDNAMNEKMLMDSLSICGRMTFDDGL